MLCHPLEEQAPLRCYRLLVQHGEQGLEFPDHVFAGILQIAQYRCLDAGKRPGLNPRALLRILFTTVQVILQQTWKIHEGVTPHGQVALVPLDALVSVDQIPADLVKGFNEQVIGSGMTLLQVIPDQALCRVQLTIDPVDGIEIAGQSIPELQQLQVGAIQSVTQPVYLAK